MNVGANSITDYGNYYQYGKGANDYSVTSGESYYEGEENPLDTSADTAAQVWGGSWHTPTKTQFEELIASTTYQWVTDFNGSGINGGKFTAANGNYVFFPASGEFIYGNRGSIGTQCTYCSSTRNDRYTSYVMFCSNGNNDVTDTYLDYGISVRPVVDA